MIFRRRPQLLAGEAAFGQAADRMVERQLRARGIASPRVLEQMRTVPRHSFVVPAIHDQAYDDNALPTRNNQTISQPYIVALMTELLDPRPGQRVLEIGTGSGYQTLILARLAGQVISIERYADLAEAARQAIAPFDPGNITVLVGDGTRGAADHAPFDRILVTAGAPTVPDPLRQQLADGGRLVIPIGDSMIQKMTVVTRRGEAFHEESGIGCRFVPLVGEHGWKHGINP